MDLPDLGGNRGGQQPGVPTRKTREARAFAREVLEDPTYRINLKKRATQGILHPLIEQMLWHYAYGKPKAIVEVQTGPTSRELADLSAEELAAVAAQTALEAAKLAADIATMEPPTFEFDPVKVHDSMNGKTH